MKKIALIICCVLGSLLSYAQDTQQSAESIWKEFQASPNSKMYTFIDGIVNSNSPKDFIPYMQRFVECCLWHRITWDALFDELKETILPKDPDVAISLGIALAQRRTSYANIFNVLKILPKSQTFENDFIEDAAVYPDGRIAIKLTDGRDYKYGWSNEDFFDKFDVKVAFPGCKEFYQVLLYQPEGKNLLGLLKYTGTNTYYDIDKAKENDKLELEMGVYLDEQGKTIGEKCWKYNSFKAYEKGIRQRGNRRR